MALRLDLKPYERLLINGALIRNGARRTDILVENQCKFLRESEVIKESEADTPCRKLCLTLQVMYLADDPFEAENLFAAQASAIMELMPSAAPFILAINDEIGERKFHRAIRRGKELVAHEAEWLAKTAETTPA